MAIRKHHWRIDNARDGVRLDHFLATALPVALGREVSRAQVRRLIMAGVVSRNGRRERIASIELRAGTRVEVAVDLARLDTGGATGLRRPVTKEFAWGPEHLLFEDEWLIVVDKPAGLPTQPTLDPSRASVFGTLQEYLRQRDGADAYLGLHHRLDRDTSGVLLFTKDRRANAGVTELFAGRRVAKTYFALAMAGTTPCPDKWEVENHLGVVGRVGKSSRFGAVRSGGDAAQTSFLAWERLANAVLVEARPHTGRTHQIRVHLAEGGNPIFGDTLYGGVTEWRPSKGGAVAIPRVMLHAGQLEFSHPITGGPVRIRSQLPADFAAFLARR